MMPSYEVAGPEVQDRIQRLIEDFYPELLDAAVDVRALMAHAEPGKNAVQLNGYRCAAVIQKVGAKERAEGLADARIIIDAETWEKLNDRRRDALIDHELHHLEVQKDKSGNIKTDDQMRPKLKMKLHDWQLGGFAAISERYGGDALEIESVRITSDHFGQLFWNWDDAPAHLRIDSHDARSAAGDDWPQLVDDPQFLEAAKGLCPNPRDAKPGDSTTIEWNGRKVTLTAEAWVLIDARLKKLKRQRKKKAGEAA